MSSVRVKRHLGSDTLRIPELKPLIGKDVQISVRDAKSGIVVTIKTANVRSGAKKTSNKSDNSKAEKSWFDTHFGAGWPDVKDDGFEDAVRTWRDEDTLRELPE